MASYKIVKRQPNADGEKEEALKHFKIPKHTNCVRVKFDD